VLVLMQERNEFGVAVLARPVSDERVMLEHGLEPVTRIGRLVADAAA
jgi:hypothetical protein